MTIHRYKLKTGIQRASRAEQKRQAAADANYERLLRLALDPAGSVLTSIGAEVGRVEATRPASQSESVNGTAQEEEA